MTTINLHQRTNANKLSPRFASAEDSSRSFMSGEKRMTRNTYKWLLRKEEAKAHPKETDIEEKKTHAIVTITLFVQLGLGSKKQT